MTKKVGRPTDYCIEIATKICEAIASSSKGIKTLCEENPEFPDRSNVFAWLRKYKEFRDLYAQAKREQIEVYANEIIEIADDNSKDVKINRETGDEQCNTEFIARSRLRIDTRKWLCSKLVPRVYGDKSEHHVTVDEVTRKIRDADGQYDY